MCFYCLGKKSTWLPVAVWVCARLDGAQQRMIEMSSSPAVAGIPLTPVARERARQRETFVPPCGATIEQLIEKNVYFDTHWYHVHMDIALNIWHFKHFIVHIIICIINNQWYHVIESQGCIFLLCEKHFHVLMPLWSSLLYQAFILSHCHNL